MEWLCCSCGLPNVASKLFDTKNSSISSVSFISQYPVRCKAKSLRILTAHFQSLWNKKDEVEAFVLDNDIDIVIGLESHLCQRISNSKFLPYGYIAFRRHRTDRWGGVLLTVKSKSICEQISISEGPELVAIRMQTYTHPLTMTACYRSPKYSKEQSKILFEEVAGLINKNKKCPIGIGSDFNLRDLDWETRSVISHQYSKDTNDKFLGLIDNCYLEQLVTFPTRANNTLDPLLTNRPSLLKRCKSAPGFRDHNSTILSDIRCHSQFPKPFKQKIYNWNKADIGQLRADVAIHMDMFIQKKYCSNTNK